MQYNVYDNRFYIYKGEDYIYDTQDVNFAMKAYINFCTEHYNDCKALL